MESMIWGMITISAAVGCWYWFVARPMEKQLAEEKRISDEKRKQILKDLQEDREKRREARYMKEVLDRGVQIKEKKIETPPQEERKRRDDDDSLLSTGFALASIISDFSSSSDSSSSYDSGSSSSSDWSGGGGDFSGGGSSGSWSND